MQEELVLAAVGEASPSHPQVLHQPQVLHLVSDQEIIKLPWSKSTPSLLSSVWKSSPTCPCVGGNRGGTKSPITRFAASLTKLLLYKHKNVHTTYTPCSKQTPLSIPGLSPSLTRLLVLIGFDAADVRGLLGHQDFNQARQTVLELGCNLRQHQKEFLSSGTPPCRM